MTLKSFHTILLFLSYLLGDRWVWEGFLLLFLGHEGTREEIKYWTPVEGTLYHCV
jgi:hypothetical protein